MYVEWKRFFGYAPLTLKGIPVPGTGRQNDKLVAQNDIYGELTV